jgi:GGDEF domain-containing protein
MLRLGVALAGIEELVFAPIVARRGSKTIRELTLARDELDRVAHLDPLTGLLNQRGFDKVVADVLASADAFGHPGAALM